MIKLLQCDLKITDSNHENNLLQNKIKIRTIDYFLGPHIDESFMHRLPFS